MSAAGTNSTIGGSASSAAAGAASKVAKAVGGKDASKTGASKKKARRKKPAGSSTKGPNSSAVLAAARSAQMELSSVKALEASRKKDPLWYRASEVTQAISADATPVPGLLNEQVDLVENALKNNHMTRSEVTPQAFGVLLEQARRYALELIADAQDCAYAAHRHDITRADLMMALELRPDQPNTHTLAELQKMTVLSHTVNKTPLPPIPKECYSGVVLPPKPHQLTTRTFDIITGAQIAQKMNQTLPAVPPRSTTSSQTSNNKTNQNPSYGVSRGRQIPINLQTGPKTQTGDSSAGPSQTEGSSGIKRKAGDM